MKKVGLYVGILASIASIIGSIVVFFPKDEKTNINIANGTLIQGNNNTVINQQVSKNIDKLYLEILTNYVDVSEKKIMQDFGEPFKQLDAGADGRFTAGLTLENHLEYVYRFDSGTLSFYIDKTSRHSSAIQLSSINVKVQVPYFPCYDKCKGCIVLSESTFDDILCMGEPRSFSITNGGADPRSRYAEFEFFFGRLNGYKTVMFGTHSWDYNIPIERIRKNYKLLNNEKPDYVIIW